jgi:CheY-like chemotaxis protein
MGLGGTTSQRSADVLLVEDEPTVRATLAEIVRRRGYEVLEAADGLEALVRLREATIGLVVLDLSMPEFDGYEVLRHMTAADPPVIVISAIPFDEAQSAGRANVIDYMAKPAQPDFVLSAVARALGPR